MRPFPFPTETSETLCLHFCLDKIFTIWLLKNWIKHWFTNASLKFHGGNSLPLHKLLWNLCRSLTLSNSFSLVLDTQIFAWNLTFIDKRYMCIMCNTHDTHANYLKFAICCQKNPYVLETLFKWEMRNYTNAFSRVLYWLTFFRILIGHSMKLSWDTVATLS